jgi:hypothetical protein
VTVRIALGLVAALVLAAFLYYVQNVHTEFDGINAAGHAIETRNPADLARAQRLLHDAGELNPDTRPELFESRLLVGFGRNREALRILNDIVRREPSNFLAWKQIEAIEQRRDPARAAEARRRLREISPPVAP